MKLFAPEIYQKRRQALLKKMHSIGGCAILLSNEIVSRNYKDETFPFRQDSTFLYYFGIPLPNLIGVLDFDQGRSILFGNNATIVDIIWMGQTPHIEDLAEQTGVKTVKGLDELSAYLVARKLLFLPQYQPGNQKQVANLLKQDAYSDELASRVFTKAVIDQRAIKGPEEIVEIEKALTFTKNIHVGVAMHAKPGLTEQQVLARALQEVHEHGLELGYNPILTKNGEILHNHHHHHVLQDQDLLLADIGAESAMGYASDITRTFPVSKQFTSIQKKLYEVVLLALNTSIEACHPGTTFQSIHLDAARTITNGLKDIGLLSGATDDIVDSGAHALFFPHGLGHMLGLDVHDMENLGEDLIGYTDEIKRSHQFGLMYLRMGRQLEEGFVMTVEPGLYFIEALINKWYGEEKFTEFIKYDQLEKFFGFGGIRLEDNILVTENGPKVLGPPIPKTVSEIEFLKSA